MLNTIVKKRTQILAVILVLSILLTATAALAATRLIKAKGGGKIKIASGVVLAIPRKALDEDTLISANVVKKGKQVCFEFEPSGLVFSKSASLGITWKAIESAGVEDLTLYGPDGIEIEPQVTKKGVVYSIDHFSIYFFRRR